MSRIERRLKKINPYASNLSTRDREKQAKKDAKAARQAADRRAAHHAEVRSGSTSWRPRWPW
ncbi:hypothetical protein [Streptomyces sp. SP17KL33]|uniref:hypothetical protein n=1 Tax=Streptomyces sp. SP17KL33 TaxID=3002534 RepID=UPI002E7652B3|nr:hypothetical protein [Streptomyces sp. SP17KL33]MEE1838187.1 hypothetical protein [Streptomyces sp. SP17KL33]